MLEALGHRDREQISQERPYVNTFSLHHPLCATVGIGDWAGRTCGLTQYSSSYKGIIAKEMAFNGQGVVQ